MDNEDPELKIVIGKPNFLAAALAGDGATAVIVTNGVAQKGLHEVGGTEDSPGDLKDHIDGVSVQKYVLPRVFRFMADLYVPKI